MYVYMYVLERGGTKGRWGLIEEGQARGAPELPEERITGNM